MDIRSSREKILGAVRQALGSGAHLPPSAASSASPLSQILPASLPGLFQAEWERLGGLFISERPEQAPGRIVELLRERQARAVLAWRDHQLPVPGLLDRLRREGFQLAGGEVQPDEPARSQRLAEIEPVTVGLTGVDAALADTGTLALRSGPGRSRLASLSVRTHLALLEPAQLHASWAAWLQAQPDPAGWAAAASNLTLISGPSRTADIEMTLTVGVHGPAEVIVLYLAGPGV